MKKIARAAILGVCASFPADAQKKPSPGPTNPELAYLRASGSGADLYLANEDGTGAYLLHSGVIGQIFDVSARDKRRRQSMKTG